MEYKDYYAVLGVPRTASAKEIKAAYRRLARRYHPDVNAGDAGAETRFKELGEAYEVLKDPEKRKRYDQLGRNWAAYQRGAPPPGAGRVRVNVGGFGGGQEFGDFSDFFQTFFGGGFGGFEGFGGGAGAGAQTARDTSADVEYPVELTLEEVLRGTARTLQLGASDRLEVKIPAGLSDGSRMRVAGRGGPRRDGSRGDLYLRIRLRKHHRFEVRDSDLQVEVEVPLTTSVLGGEAKVPTLEGEREIRVPPGSPPGRIFRLREQGLPKKGGGRGDLLATLQVALPRNVTGREKELFEELRRLGL